MLARWADPQIPDQRVADVDRQGHRVLAMPLAMHEQLARTPINIIQSDRGDLPALSPSLASNSRTAKSRRPITGSRSHDANIAVITAGTTAFGSDRPRRSATGGTAHTSGVSISPATCRYRSSWRSRAARSLAADTERRGHSRAKNPLTSAVVSRSSSSAPARATRSSRNTLAPRS